MIRPTKYADLRVSILNVSANIIKNLKEDQNLLYDELMSKVVNTLGNNARYTFSYALILLFSVGFLEYDPSLDVIMYKK